MNVSVPLVGDFHFNGHKLLADNPACAEALDKLRINPGNVGRGAKRDEQFGRIIEIACQYDKPVRIGVNWGSLDPALLARIMDENAARPQPKDASGVMREAMVASALESAQRAEELGLPHDAIVLSCKVSGVQNLIAIYRDLAGRCDYPLHLGLTEAGMGSKGIVALDGGPGSAVAGRHRRHHTRFADAGARRQPHTGGGGRAGIAADHGVAGVYADGGRVPGCGRTTSSFFQELAQDIQDYVREQMPLWREHYDGVENMTLAVMGCVVNGPGESRHANIGISLPGAGETPVAPVYVDGEKTVTLKGDGIAGEFRAIVDAYVATHFARDRLRKARRAHERKLASRARNERYPAGRSGALGGIRSTRCAIGCAATAIAPSACPSSNRRRCSRAPSAK